MAAETKDQALDLVAAIFVRAGERVPRRSEVDFRPQHLPQQEREAA